MARRRRNAFHFPGPVKGSWLLGASLLLLGLLAARHLERREAFVTIHLDHAQGLQEGDGVYLQDTRIGTVHRIQSYGFRIEIQLAIPRFHLGKVPPGSLFLLYRDGQETHRRSILVIPGGSR